MLSSAIGTLTDRIDSKFLTAYWLPAFVAAMGGLGMWASLVGPNQVGDWATDLDSIEQSLVALLLLLAITMLAFVLRALSRTIIEFVSGEILPRAVADWATRRQLKIKHAAEQARGVSPDNPASFSAAGEGRPAPLRVFPRADAATQPTLFGNVLAAAADQPWLAYAMNGTLWWPRLTPLLPADFRSMLGGTLAPMMALLNLSVNFAGLALCAGPVLGVLGGSGRQRSPSWSWGSFWPGGLTERR